MKINLNLTRGIQSAGKQLGSISERVQNKATNIAQSARYLINPPKVKLAGAGGETFGLGVNDWKTFLTRRPEPLFKQNMAMSGAEDRTSRIEAEVKELGDIAEKTYEETGGDVDAVEDALRNASPPPSSSSSSSS